MNAHKIHAMPEGDGTARLHTSLGYQSVVRIETIKHERGYADLWTATEKFPNARALVRFFGNCDRVSTDAVY